MTTPTPGTAGDPQRPEPTGSDPTREIEVGHPAQEQPATEPVSRVPAAEAQLTEEQESAHTRVFGGATYASGAPAPAVPEEPRRPSGPHLPPVLLGIVCLAIAGLAIWQEVTDVQVDWGNVGPFGIVAIGALLVLLGLVGLLGSRRHRSS
ncbi:hypothetical protein ACFUC1_10950 [Pedococcus sp. NPDC057267]|uniref:hypothetical protein n=1 Tax=Pedococcus sp. NPDC057267 TaxID=3346077 RepID=UPI003632231F